MRDTVSGADFDCRYIREGPKRDGAFARFVAGLGIELPVDVTLNDAIRYGWATPRLRIAPPEEYFLDWIEYPQWSSGRTVKAEHLWADWVFRGEFAVGVKFAGKGRLLREWYLHPLDVEGPDLQEVMKHAIATDKEPEPFKHPKAGLVYPFVDLFPYWQAYSLMEAVQSVRVFKPKLTSPDGMAAVRSWQDSRLRREKTFEWISLYRTLLAAAVLAPGKRPNERAGCQQSAEADWSHRR